MLILFVSIVQRIFGENVKVAAIPMGSVGSCGVSREDTF